MSYTIKDFNKEFPDDDTCLKTIFEQRFGAVKVCTQCKKETNFYRVSNRKCFACQFCGFQLHPLADTIFNKSSTPLKLWFFAIFLMSQSKNGVSAKELERHLGVTYKTAWRMAKEIRNLMNQNNDKSDGTFEADETYIGGKGKYIRGRGAKQKTPVFGVVKRGGGIVVKAVGNVKTSTVMPIVRQHVAIGSTLNTDEYHVYKNSCYGFKHNTVRHGDKEYVRGEAHTNTIEGFWSQLKRSINGTFHSVSKKHLQKYLNEFAWKYNNRASATPLFSLLLAEVRTLS